jgi:hypothetical protein
MPVDRNVLLHETPDSLRDARSPHSTHRAGSGRDLAGEPDLSRGRVIVTGIASPGKRRLVEALRARLSASGLRVESCWEPRPSASGRVALHVHADTDLDALVESGQRGGLLAASGGADVRVPVDWEGVDGSVRRIVEALDARGPDPGRAGA